MQKLLYIVPVTVFIGGLFLILHSYQWELLIKPTIVNQAPINVDENLLFRMINKWRVDNKFKPYNKNNIICAVADKRLPEIIKNFSHEDFQKEIQKIKYKSMGENLVKGYDNEEDILNSWLNSQEHYENLVKPYTDSCVRCRDIYCIQLFATF